MLGRHIAMLLVLSGLMPLPQVAIAQLLTDLPANARGIDVQDRVGKFIPLELQFKDERGNPVGLARYFNTGKPVVLTLNYSDCPGLCVAQLDNLVSLLREINGGGIGDDFEIVTVSIDPSETPLTAARTKAKYTGLLRGTKAEESWHFLTGKRTDIAALADSVGFRYTYDAVNKRYNHPAATYFISPNGRICRYLLSLGVEPQQFKMALGESREGKLAPSLADAIIQFCYLYDPDANRYSASARRMMSFAGGAFVLLLTGASAPFWFSKKAKAAKLAAAETSQAKEENLPESVADPHDS